jgi:hypothetical protein
VTPETRGTDSGVRRSEPAPRVEQPRVERQRVERQNVEPLRISPPIVRERSMPRSESGGGGFSRGSESRPQMSAPTPRGGGEVRSGGGGGNRGGGESHGGGGSRGGGRGR